MKKEILSNNVLMKSLALCVMMLFSFNGMAQEYTHNIGCKGKVYYWSYKAHQTDYYIANIISSKEHSFTKELLADKIFWYSSVGFGYISPSPGYFIEFIYEGQPAMECHKYGVSEGDVMMVLDGSNLYLVEENGDSPNYDSNGVAFIGIKTIGTITNDLNDRGDDFQIFWTGDYINILNNGILKGYSIKNIKNTSSVRSPEVDKSDSKTYSLDGKQVDSPHDGIFIRGGKKVVIK